MKRPSTKERLIEAGMNLLLEHGYNGLGLEALLATTSVTKGSFYHHFRDKEDFALAVVDAYMTGVHAGLDACLSDRKRPALDRVRGFFEMTQEKYESEGYMGCLLGGLGQELAGVSETFRKKIESCFTAIAKRLTTCLEEARQAGELPKECEVKALADLLVDCWEGAALRSRLRGNPKSLRAMLDFYFKSVAVH